MTTTNDDQKAEHDQTDAAARAGVIVNFVNHGLSLKLTFSPMSLSMLLWVVAVLLLGVS